MLRRSCLGWKTLQYAQDTRSLQSCFPTFILRLFNPRPRHIMFLVPTPSRWPHIDFAPTFYHIVEFSTFVVEQTKYIYSLKFSKSLAHNKPKILVSLSYNEFVDLRYIAKITAKAMLNPSELILQSSPWNLISPVLVLWDSQEYISKIGPKNTRKNLDFEEDLRARFPPGPVFPQLRGRETEFDTPMIITDPAGHILCWYLSDIISMNAQVLPHYFRLSCHWSPQTLQAEWYNLIETLNDVLKSDSRNVAIPEQITKVESCQGWSFPWRWDPKFFSKGQHLSLGIINITAIWFQARHLVGQVFLPWFLV